MIGEKLADGLCYGFVDGRRTRTTKRGRHIQSIRYEPYRNASNCPILDVP